MSKEHDHTDGGGSHKGHDHAAGVKNEKSLLIAIGLTGSFMIAEVIGGILTHSLALLSDAAHMLTDVMALVIALVAIRIGRREADPQRTYGYRRFEVLAAAFNALALLGVAIYILVEAIERFINPPVVETSGMLILAVLGLAINLISMRVLAGGSDTSLNIKGAYLEVLSDMLGSVAVIIGAGIIYFTGWTRIDPILAVLIGLWVLPRTWTLLSSSLHILLEGSPEGMDVKKLLEDLHALPGVIDVHDLHVWSITSGQHSLTAHLQVNELPENDSLLRAACDVARSYNVTHTNFQIELDHMGGLGSGLH